MPRYRGGPRERDGAYHQGTVWPWLIGPFVEAWLRVRGDSADGDPPHVPGGCPFQAWSLGELIRMRRLLGDAVPPVPA